MGASSSTTGRQPSGCRGASIAPWCSVNAAFLFVEPGMLVVEDAPTKNLHPLHALAFS